MTMRRRAGVGADIFGLTALLLAVAGAPPAVARPSNIVLIVADDLGFSDLGSYGGEIETPALDRLALGGIRFTRFYGSARCSPSRAALLTGVWPHEAGVGHLANDWNSPGYRGEIHASVPTIAERLRRAGYSTHMVGKWHLTTVRPEGDRAADEGAEWAPASWPLQRGFDSFYGTLGGSDSYFDPELYDGNQRAAWPPSDAAPQGGDNSDPPYLTDVLGERAAGVVTQQLATAPDRPFFLYLAFNAPHWPMMAPAPEIERHRGRFDAGWDELRAARFERQRELGILARDSALPPRDPGVAAWSDAPDREWQLRRMEVYAAMVSTMDRAVARVIASLEAAGALDDTLVVFVSDNGACAEEFRGVYALASFFVQHPRQTADGRPVRFGDRPEIEPGPADTYSTYGRSWAHLSNTPLRSYKHWTYEGGITVPFFVHWPAQLASSTGSIVTVPAHMVDVVPTLEQIVAAQSSSPPEVLPPKAASQQPPLRGQSLVPLLRGEAIAERTLYWEHEGNRAIADGDWKLVSRWPSGWELYDLASDRFETNDLAAANPERVTDMAARFDEWAASVGVEPWPFVVPWIETVLSTGITVVALLLIVVRAARSRRGGAPPRSPGPFPGKRSQGDHKPPPPPPPAAGSDPHPWNASDRPRPITPR